MAATAAQAAPSAHKPHAPIPPPHHPTYNIQQVLRDALKEDAGDLGDITTLATIPPETQAVATFLAKASGTLAGLAVVDWVCEEVDARIKVTWTAKDGDRVSYGLEFGRLEGPAGSILVAERVALNFLQRMSGIATYTHAMVKAAEGYPARILETRKTVPGLRLLDKWAVLIGGGSNHRIGLFDMMMIKDNHIAAAGGMAAAVRRAEEYIRSHNLADMKVEVETRNSAEVAEVKQLLLSGSAPHVSRVMLDNMTRKDPSQPGGVDVALLREAVSELKATGVETEASGNVTLETVRTIASTGVTFISCGSLTHSVTALDISLNIKTQ